MTGAHMEPMLLGLLQWAGQRPSQEQKVIGETKFIVEPGGQSDAKRITKAGAFFRPGQISPKRANPAKGSQWEGAEGRPVNECPTSYGLRPRPAEGTTGKGKEKEMINWLGGLKKEVHLVKVLGRDQEKYEPSLIITKEKAKGRSFQIPLPAFWKYVDPKDNADALPGDAEEFKKILETANFKMLFYKHMTPEPAARKQAKIDIADWILAATIFKQTKIFAKAVFIAGVLNLFLNIIFVPYFGIIAAAAITFISYVLLGGMYFFASRKYLKFPLNLKFIIKSILASIVMAIVVFLLSPAGVAGILLAVGVGIVVYFLALILLNGISKKEFNILNIDFFKKSIRRYLKAITVSYSVQGGELNE